ncbi:MAG: hypothetical protein KC964_27345, partial [Candidatus Omnitrophica bacterium]|nr:hypothetical protein [Candidatus Omnitrophota bacterium]
MRSIYNVIACIAILFAQDPTLAGSWPTHRADTSRSGVTEEQLKFPLKQAWLFESKYPPQPAWSGPARR